MKNTLHILCNQKNGKISLILNGQKIHKVLKYNLSSDNCNVQTLHLDIDIDHTDVVEVDTVR